jgi:leader peptidase (prepilin peptidase)/N-methyltransferase
MSRADLPVLSILSLSIAPLAGSFVASLAYRLPRGVSIVWPRSYCPHCRATLGAADLVPLLSWLVQRGRCRHCAAIVGYTYPLIELTAVAIAIWAVSTVPGSLALSTAVLGWLLLALALIDWQHYMLPNLLTVPVILAGLLVATYLPALHVMDHLIGAAAGYLAFWLVSRIYRAVRHRDGLGLGDAKLIAGAGAWVGWQGLPTVVMAGAVTALMVTLLLNRHGKGTSPTARVPFGPYLAFATWLVWLYGPLQFG